MKNLIKKIIKEELDGSRKRRKSQNDSTKKNFKDLLLKKWTDTAIGTLEEFYGITKSYLQTYELISEIIEEMIVGEMEDFNDVIGIDTHYHDIDADYKYKNPWWKNLANQLKIQTEKNGNPTYEFIEDVVSLMNETFVWLQEILDEVEYELKPGGKAKTYDYAYDDDDFGWFNSNEQSTDFTKFGGWVYDEKTGWSYG